MEALMSKDTRVHRGSDGNLYLVREHKTRPKPEPKPKPPKEGEQSAEDKKAKRRKRRRRLRKSFGSSSRSESEGFVSPSRTSGTQQTTGKKDNNGYDSPSRHDSDSPLNSDFNSSDSIGSRSNYYTSDSRRLDPDFKAPSRITRVVNFLLGTSSVEPKMADQEKMAHSSERFEKASTTSSEKITELPLPPGTNPPPGVNLPPGFYPQAGIYQQGGRTMALLPKSQIMEMGGFPQQGFGPQYMYPPQMGPHMMMGGFGGFNSRYEPARPTEVTTVVPGTNVTVARHICANCGTLRSRKFQAENPIEPGEVAPISYCRKCEKEIKSTDSEDSEYDIDFGKGKKPKVKKVDTSSKRVEKKAPKNKLHKKASKSSIKVEKTVLVVDKADTAFLHTCAQCGKARSRKYQARHPIKKGQPPTPAFCGKCQKEETSSEDSAASDSEDESDDSIQSRRRGGDRYIKTKEKVRAAPPDRAPGVYLPPSVESVGSESDSEYESDQIVRVTKSKSNRKKNKQVPPSDVPFGTYLKDLIFGKQKHESVDYEVQVQEKHRGRSRHKHAVSSAEMPLNHYMEQLSPLVHEYQKVDLRRTKSVDRYEGTGRGHARARSASRHVPKEHRSKRNEHEYRHYERTASSEDEEEKAYEVFETYMSDGLPMREHEQRYRARARDKRASMQEPLQAFESFEPPHFSDNSKSRRRERRGSQIAMPPPAMPAPPAAQQYYTEPAPPVRPRDPDEVIVTTERYVYNNKDGTQTHIESRRVSEHHEHEHEHGSNGSSKRRSHTSSRPSNRFVTHEDQANYYHDDWAPRDHGRRASMAEPVPQRAQSRQQSHSLSPENTSTTPVPGSFVDIEEAQAYYDDKHLRRLARAQAQAQRAQPAPPPETESMTSGYTSGTYTTDSRSGSGHTPGSGSWNNRNTYAPDRGQAQRRPAKNNYTPPHLPGEYHSVSDEESELTPREDKRRSNHHHERNRHHDRQFDASPPRRDSSSYRRPTVHLDTDSDFAMAGSALPERDPSRDRRAFAQPYPEFDITDPRNFTAMDRINMLSGLDRDGSAASSAEREREPFIRREDLKARARRVSFGANEYKTISRNNSQGTTATEEARREREDVERRRERRREERSRQRPGPRDLRETLEREAEKVVLEKVLPRVLPKVLDKVYPRDPRDKAREKKERERDRDREYGYASH